MGKKVCLSVPHTSQKSWEVIEISYSLLYWTNCRAQNRKVIHKACFKPVNSHCQLLRFNISIFSFQCLWCKLQGVDFCPEFNAFVLTKSLFEASSHDHRWEGGSSVTQWLTGKIGGKREKTTWSVWQTFRAALWVITIHIPGCLALLSLFPSTNLAEFHHGRAMWLWKRRHKINIRESDRSRAPDQVRVNGVGPEASLFMLTWSYPICRCLVLSGVLQSHGGVQRARPLTGLMYQPWRSQLVGDLKTRWRRAENDENVEGRSRTF